jgi:hypothetical protein
MSTLPTSEQLEKLTVRAIVAYAARAVQRVRSELQELIADELMADVILAVENSLTPQSLAQPDSGLALVAAERVVAAYVETPGDMRSAEKSILVFSFVQAALTAMHAVLAVKDRADARGHLKRATQAAELAVCPTKFLGKDPNDALRAAFHDYEILLQEYGEHDEVVLGDPVQCFGG